MQVWRSAEVLTENEMELIHNYALRMLEEVGAIVQNETVLRKLEEYGAKVDYQNEKVYFSREFMEKFIVESEPVEKDFDPTQIKVFAGTYGAFWMTPEGKVEKFTQNSIKDYIKLCQNLDNVDVFTIPIPHDMGSLKLTPLYMRLLAWKYIEPKGPGSDQVQDHRLIPYIIEMGKIMADRFGEKVSDYVSGDIELQSPFRCSKEEALILVSLWEKGFHCGIGGPMPMSGGTSPVTLAGTLTQNIAETLFRSVITRVMNGYKTLAFGMGLGLMDMRTGNFLRSRPENGLFALALGQIVHNFYRGYFRGHSFDMADAQTPSIEAGFENAMCVFTGILAGSRYIGGLGLICGPTGIISALKLIIDNECVGFLKRFLKCFEINEETIAFDLVKEVGPGGNFLDKVHTVENFKREHWQPSIFNRDTYQKWITSGSKTDLDKAKEIYLKIMEKEDVKSKIDEKTEKSLLRVIHLAEEKLK